VNVGCDRLGVGLRWIKRPDLDPFRRRLEGEVAALGEGAGDVREKFQGEIPFGDRLVALGDGSLELPARFGQQPRPASWRPPGHFSGHGRYARGRPPARPPLMHQVVNGVAHRQHSADEASDANEERDHGDHVCGVSEPTVSL
jgi:hypothetical protein